MWHSSLVRTAVVLVCAPLAVFACASQPGIPPDILVEAGPHDGGTILPPFDASYVDVEVEADIPPADAGPEAAPMGCATQQDGTPCKAAPDLCHTDGVCKMGKCMAPAVRPDGYNWKLSDVNARCCSGIAIDTTNDANCGACGIACNASNGESCSPLAGHYFCRGCKTNVGCWSGCCSLSFSPSSCAASDCKGNCDSTHCPPGSKCVLGNGMSSNYCAY